jgi:hypothetical protein
VRLPISPPGQVMNSKERHYSDRFRAVKHFSKVA